MRIVLLGAPGSGKGTQAKMMAEAYRVPQISTGDILRKAVADKTEVGKKVAAMMDAGELVSDRIVIDAVTDHLRSPDSRRGFVLDGFPRTIPQAQAISDAGIKIDVVVEISVDDEEIVSRLSGRRVHENSGRVYHVEHNPPKVTGFDDDTGEPLVQRLDDLEDTVRNRLFVYHEQTKPLVKFYTELEDLQSQSPKFSTVNGLGLLSDVQARLVAAME